MENAIREKKITQADLWKIPAMKPGFMRKPRQKLLFRTKTGSYAPPNFNADSEMGEAKPTENLQMPEFAPVVPSAELYLAPSKTPTFQLLDPTATTLEGLVHAFNDTLKKQDEFISAIDYSQEWQKEMESTVGSLASGHNYVVNAVSTLGKWIQPIIADSRVMKNIMRAATEAMQAVMNNRDTMEATLGDTEQAVTDLTQEVIDVNTRAKENDTLIDNIHVNLSVTMDLSKALDSRTKWPDPNQRSYNIIIFG